MTCPLYAFCNNRSQYTSYCSINFRKCEHLKSLEKWITGLIDSAIENAMEDVE